MFDRWLVRIGAACATAGVLIIGDFLPSLADERCSQLEILSRQYADVELNTAQRAIKRRFVVWYDKNCRLRRTAQD